MVAGAGDLGGVRAAGERSRCPDAGSRHRPGRTAGAPGEHRRPALPAPRSGDRGARVQPDVDAQRCGAATLDPGDPPQSSAPALPRLSVGSLRPGRVESGLQSAAGPPGSRADRRTTLPGDGVEPGATRHAGLPVAPDLRHPGHRRARPVSDRGLGSSRLRRAAQPPVGGGPPNR